MEWKNIYRGMAMGMIDVVPGISSSTIAILLGIYDRLIASISGLFSKDWKKHLQFLIPLGIGIAIALFTFSHVMVWLLENYHRPTFFFFIGLIIGVVPFLLYESEAKTKFRFYHYVLLLLGIVFVNLFPVSSSGGTIIEERSIPVFVMLFIAGILASAAMILPGVSGSFVLVVIGMYPTVIHAVSELDLPVIVVVGAGIAIGMFTMSKIIHYFFQKFRTGTYALLIGIVVGSTAIIFKQAGLAGSMREWILCTIVFLGGLVVANLLGRFEYR